MCSRPPENPPTPPPHQRAGVTQPACNYRLTPQAWLLRNEKESPAAPPRLPASAQELKGAQGAGSWTPNTWPSSGSRSHLSPGGTKDPDQGWVWGEGAGCQDLGSQAPPMTRCPEVGIGWEGLGAQCACWRPLCRTESGCVGGVIGTRTQFCGTQLKRERHMGQGPQRAQGLLSTLQATGSKISILSSFSSY